MGHRRRPGGPPSRKEGFGRAEAPMLRAEGTCEATIKRLVPVWAFQFCDRGIRCPHRSRRRRGVARPLMRGATAFFDELGKTMSRIAPSRSRTCGTTSSSRW